MAKPLTDDEREHIAHLCRQGLSRNDIARHTGRSHDTITRIATMIGHRFGQSNLAHAHEARSAYGAERRAEIARRAAERAVELLEGFDGPQPVAVATPNGPEVLELRPDARAQRDRASALASLSKVVLDIDRHDNRGDEGAAAVDRWLRDIVGETVGGSTP